MNKEKALERLQQIESETKELRKIIEAPEKLIDTVTTISEVYKKLGRKELTINDFDFLPKNKRIKALNFQHIQAIEELFNEGWKPDWGNSNEYKYYPYFQFSSGGWRLYDSCSYSCNSSSGDPGLYKTQEISNYVGKTFISIYSNYLNN